MTGSALPPLVEPARELSPAERTRYARQLRLPTIGETGQRRLAAARVLVLGAGGIGSPVIAYLAAAGVGSIGIIDSDRVDESNLHRQLTHSTADVGRSKAESAAESARLANPFIEAVAIDEEFRVDNADRLVEGWDLLVDGFDTFSSRYIASDAAERAGIPHVWGSALGLDGQVSVFWAAAPGGGVTLRDLHPSAFDEGDTCATVGVLGPLCGTIGTMMATEVVKLIVGFGETLLGRVLVHDALDSTWAELPLGLSVRVRDGLVEHDETESDAARRSATENRDARVITTSELVLALGEAEPPVLLDIRETDEDRSVVIPGSRWMPQSALRLDELDVPHDHPLVVYCASGTRSRAVAGFLAAAGWDDVATLRGGALGWSLTPR